MPIFFLLFIVLPATELALLIEIGRRIGTLATLALIVLTGALGAALARHQGLQVLRTVEAETRQGRMPAGALVDGLIILVAAALLVTPGVLTDVFGFLCLVPLSREVMKRVVVRWFERRIQRGEAAVVFSFHERDAPFAGPDPPRRHPRPVIDVTPEDEDPPSGR